jgi:hypothetical protein
MKYLEERTPRLSLAVIFNDAAVPDVHIEKDEVSLLAIGIMQEPFYQRSGYWLFMDLPAGSVTLSWKAIHYEDGEHVVDPSMLPNLAPVVPISLVMPSPVTVTFSNFSRGKVGVPYEIWVTTSGGKPPIFFEAINLPPGLIINSSTGLISGIPTKNIRVYVTLNITDNNGTHDEITKRITILA